MPQAVSLASRVLRLFQLMPSHIEEALALVALELAAQAFTTVAFIVVQPYAVEWRWASALLPSALLPTEHTEVITRHAADTTPTRLATRNCR